MHRTEIQTISHNEKKKVYVAIDRIVMLLVFLSLRIRILLKFSAGEKIKTIES